MQRSGGSQPTVAIVGCGPAGVAAAVYFAKRGMRVKVFEKRAHPSQISSANEDRAFVISLNKRGRRGLTEAGFDLERLCTPGSGIVTVDTFVLATSSLLPWNRNRNFSPSTAALVGDRMSWIRELVKQAEGMGLGIEFFWESPLHSINLDSRVATFQGADGSLQGVRYDLLLGADGSHSKVRAELEAQLPEMKYNIEPNTTLYKVFRNVTLPDAANGKKLPPIVVFTTRLHPSNPKSLSIIAVPNAFEGKACGMVNMPAPGWEGLALPSDYEKMLRMNSSRIPEGWLAPVCKQLASRPLNVSGYRVCASQLHGPSVVLVGDAGHGVTPMTGNGMNSAFEDVWLLNKLLDAGTELAALPEAFNAARLEDAQALLWLDSVIPYRFGRRGMHWRYIFTETQWYVRHMLRWVLGSRVDDGVLTRVRDPIPFTQVKRAVILEDALTAIGLAGSVALAGWALLAMLA